jgi:hypothetical protein
MHPQPKNFQPNQNGPGANPPGELGCGGGTDVCLMPTLHGGCVLNATISRYVYGPRAKVGAFDDFAPSITGRSSLDEEEHLRQ